MLNFAMQDEKKKQSDQTKLVRDSLQHSSPTNVLATNL